MLSAAETKVVLSTLTQRRAWLRKTLDQGKLDESQREEFIQTAKVIDSAIQKLAAMRSNQSSAEPAASGLGNRTSVTLENARVLVAEDQDDSRQMLVDMLVDMGIKSIEEAKDGRDAFDKIKNNDNGYDIILCDWDMPELSGIEVHTKAKASKKLRGAYFCMVTGMTESDKIRKAIGSGVNDYIVKPIDGAILESKIKATIDARNKAG